MSVDYPDEQEEMPDEAAQMLDHEAQYAGQLANGSSGHTLAEQVYAGLYLRGGGIAICRKMENLSS